MTLSIWRYCHLGFALTFSTFILIASVTGIILAIEPIEDNINSQKQLHRFNDQSIAKTIRILENKYAEIYSFEIKTNNRIVANVALKNGKNKRIYVNPLNGIEIGIPKERKKIYKWATSLHRSLFLKKTGRVLMALCSLFLCLITLTGVLLIVKRQGGGLNFFKKVVKESNNQYFHVVLGRWFVLPILFVTISGVLLSLEKLNILPKEKSSHNIDFNSLRNSPQLKNSDFEIFKNTPLNNFQKIEFPFSDDVEDYYTLYLTDKEILVNQVTGDIISEYIYPINNIVSYYSFIIHTGQKNILWAIVLLLVCIGILYFMYSGFSMTIARSKLTIKNSINKHNAKIGIFVGSEGGTTFKYANALHKQLLKQNVSSYVAELNKFEIYENLEQIIILTATYGDGEPPTNARKFIKKLENIIIEKDIQYSIVGFGSIAYKNFCQFAFDIKNKLQTKVHNIEAVPLTTINNNSFEAYNDWIKKIATHLDIKITIKKEELGFKKIKTFPFKVQDITPETSRVNNTFLLKLKPEKKLKFQSGDLLALYPKNESKERLYSISKTINNEVLIAVKKHDFGLISNYLSKQTINNTIKGGIVKNKTFHFPKKNSGVIFIATGTGIGPFLGMIENNHSKITTTLFWGGKTENSFSLYNSFIQNQIRKGTLNKVHTAFSRENEEKVYIQDIIHNQGNFFAKSLENKNVIMICGSVAMQKDVIKTLNDICSTKNKKPLSFYENKGQVLMDCY